MNLRARRAAILIGAPVRGLRPARALRLEWSGEKRRVTRVIYRDANGSEQAIEQHGAQLAVDHQGAMRLSGAARCDGRLGRSR